MMSFSRIFAPVVSFIYNNELKIYEPVIQIGFWNTFDGQRKRDDSRSFQRDGLKTYSLHDTDDSLRSKVVYNFIPLHLSKEDRTYTPNFASLRTLIYYFCHGVPPDDSQLIVIRDNLLEFMNFFMEDIFAENLFEYTNFSLISFNYVSVKRMIRNIQKHWVAVFDSFNISMMDIGRAVFMFVNRESVERYFFNFYDMLYDRIKGTTPLENICNHPIAELYFHTTNGKFLVSDVMAFFPANVSVCCFRRLTANFYEQQEMNETDSLSNLVNYLKLGEMRDCFEGTCNHEDAVIPALISADLKGLLSVRPGYGTIIDYSYELNDHAGKRFEFLITPSDKSAVITPESIPRLVVGQYYDCWVLAHNSVDYYTSDYRGFSFHAMKDSLMRFWTKLASNYNLPATSKITVFGNVLRQWEPPHVMFVLEHSFTWDFFVDKRMISLTLKSCTTVFLVTVSNLILQFIRNKGVWKAACVNPFLLGTYDMISSLVYSDPHLVGLYVMCRTLLSTFSVDLSIFRDIEFKQDRKGTFIYTMEAIQKQLFKIKFNLNNSLASLATFGDDRFFMSIDIYEKLDVSQRNYVLPTTYPLYLHDCKYFPKSGSIFTILCEYAVYGDCFLAIRSVL